MDYLIALTTLCGIILSTGLSPVTDAAKWGYLGEKGTEYWAELFPDACAGEYQSPIDIDTANTVYNPELRDFSIFFDPPLPGSKFVLKNNGHAVQVDTEGEFYVTNGGLKSVYKTAQFHFHWGHANHHGSEHTVNGVAAPIEMHIVSWNSDEYNSIGEAVTAEGGLAVLGILFEISQEDNLVLEPLVNKLMHIRDPDKKVTREIPAVAMRNFLPPAPWRYYRYNGSLTTPGCFESVVWTVFHEKQTISRRQLRVFRQVLKPKHKKHKRSIHRDRNIVQSVMEEIGIEDNAYERSRFRRNLETKKDATYTVENGMNGANATEPRIRNHGSQENTAGQTPTESPHAHDPKPEPISTVTSGSVKDMKTFDDIRKILVNNFRSVQPLNGRTVYRSFPFFDQPSKQETRIVYVEKEVQKASSGAPDVTSASLISLALLCIAQKFLR